MSEQEWWIFTHNKYKEKKLPKWTWLWKSGTLYDLSRCNIWLQEMHLQHDLDAELESRLECHIDVVRFTK